MFLKIGHRGTRGREVENTLESFGRAIELGVNAIELDVRRSGDGHLIISHDDNLKKVYDKDLRINDAALAELKDLTEGRLITLEEAFSFIDGKVEKILVELKETGYEQEVLHLIREKRLEDRVVIISFHEEALARIRDLDKQIETGLIYTKYKKPIDRALALNAQYLVPLYRFVHRKDVAKAHKNNLRVLVWTINSKSEAVLYRAKDVDGIATDKPDIFRGMA